MSHHNQNKNNGGMPAGQKPPCACGCGQPSCACVNNSKNPGTCICTKDASTCGCRKTCRCHRGQQPQ